MLVDRENVLPSPFMNILIEDAEKMEYLTGNEQWSKNVDKGRNFGSTAVAFDFAKKEPIGKFNIVSYITQTKQFINLDHGRGRGPAEAGAVLENAAAA